MMEPHSRQRVQSAGGAAGPSVAQRSYAQPEILFKQQSQPEALLRKQSPRSTASPVGSKQAYSGGLNFINTVVEPVAESHRPTTTPAMQPSVGYVPEPPAPRSWTPSKVSTANNLVRLTASRALEQEISEIACSDSNAAATATVSVAYNSTTRSKQVAGVTSGAGGFGSPTTTKRGYFNSAFEEPAKDAVQTSRSASPAQPFVAQHNNLMAGGGEGDSAHSSRPGSSGSASGSGGIGKLRERLVGNGSNNVTTVQVFREPTDNAVVASALSATSSSGSCHAPVAAQRAAKATRLVNGHASSSCRTVAEWHSEFATLLAAGNKLAALELPGPSNGVVQCYVQRTAGLLGMAPSFELRVESSDDLLAVARKRKKSTSSSYLISMEGEGASIKRGDEQLVAKLKANVMGTEYLLQGKGGDVNAHKGFNAQLLAVNYKPTINHLRTGPRTMTAVVPVPESQTWGGNTSSGSQYDQLTVCMEAARARELPMSFERDLVMLHTMQPHYDPIKKVHYLDFKGRVTKLSLKNFQLVHWDHNTNHVGNDLVMLFGKKGHDEYAMDFCYPMNTLQAFAVALSSIDSKFCYAM